MDFGNIIPHNILTNFPQRASYPVSIIINYKYQSQLDTSSGIFADVQVVKKYMGQQVETLKSYTLSQFSVEFNLLSQIVTWNTRGETSLAN